MGQLEWIQQRLSLRANLHTHTLAYTGHARTEASKTETSLGPASKFIQTLQRCNWAKPNSTRLDSTQSKPNASKTQLRLHLLADGIGALCAHTFTQAPIRTLADQLHAIGSPDTSHALGQSPSLCVCSVCVSAN